MQVIETPIEGLYVFEPTVWRDSRGAFVETFQVERYASILGSSLRFVQDNFSRSVRSVIRGLHYQVARPQGKLVTCLSGRIFDAVVDLRAGSATFGQSFTVELDGESLRQLWIPPGFAHGFCVLSDAADCAYKCTDYYDPADEAGILWSDPDLNISWPISEPIVSEKDQHLPLFSAVFG